MQLLTVVILFAWTASGLPLPPSTPSLHPPTYPLDNEQTIKAFRSAESVSIDFAQTCPQPSVNHPPPCPLTPAQQSFKASIAQLWNATHPDRPSPIQPPTQNLRKSQKNSISHKNNKLTRRAHYAWIGSYASQTCENEPEPDTPRPKLYSNCVPFSPSTDTVGVSWGSWPLGVGTLDVFESVDCSGSAFETWKAPRSVMGPGSCVDVGGVGRRIGSVMNRF